MNTYTNWLTRLPPLTHTFLDLYSLSFICTHFPLFVLTSLHLYSLTFTLVPYMSASMTFSPYMWASMTFWPKERWRTSRALTIRYSCLTYRSVLQSAVVVRKCIQPALNRKKKFPQMLATYLRIKNLSLRLQSFLQIFFAKLAKPVEIDKRSR